MKKVILVILLVIGCVYIWGEGGLTLVDDKYLVEEDEDYTWGRFIEEREFPEYLKTTTSYTSIGGYIQITSEQEEMIMKYIVGYIKGYFVTPYADFEPSVVFVIWNGEYFVLASSSYEWKIPKWYVFWSYMMYGNRF